MITAVATTVGIMSISVCAAIIQNFNKQMDNILVNVMQRRDELKTIKEDISVVKDELKKCLIFLSSTSKTAAPEYRPGQYDDTTFK